MKRAFVASLLVVAAALVAPLAARAHPNAHQAITVRIELPITFSDADHACPFGTVSYGISSNGKAGDGSNCLQDIVPVDCPPTVEALFCQEVSALMALRLPGGTIEGAVTLFEVWRCGDPHCVTLAVDQRWSGTVARATGAFHSLEGQGVSGGGTFVLDATTFEPLSIDETLVIGGEAR